MKISPAPVENAGLGRVYRYNKRVFLAQPWPEIYTLGEERLHDFAEALAEYDCLIAVYPALGYDIHVLPKVSVAERPALDSRLAGALMSPVGPFRPFAATPKNVRTRR